MRSHRGGRLARLGLVLQLTWAGCFMDGYAGLVDLDASGGKEGGNDAAAAPTDAGLDDGGSVDLDTGSAEASLAQDATLDPSDDGALPSNCRGQPAVCSFECDGEPTCAPQCLVGAQCDTSCGSSPVCNNVCLANEICRFDCGTASTCNVDCQPGSNCTTISCPAGGCSVYCQDGATCECPEYGCKFTNCGQTFVSDMFGQHCKP